MISHRVSDSFSGLGVLSSILAHGPALLACLIATGTGGACGPGSGQGSGAGSGGTTGTNSTGGATNSTGGATGTGGATSTGGTPGGSAGAGVGGATNADAGSTNAAGATGMGATTGSAGSNGTAGSVGASSSGTDAGANMNPSDALDAGTLDVRPQSDVQFADVPAGDAQPHDGSDAASDVSSPIDAAPDGAAPPPNGKVDILFLVDDSVSMEPLQAKLGQGFSAFMNTLESQPRGLPSLHIAVVSSSLGSGIYGNVNGCQPNTAGNQNGTFLHPANCTALPAQLRFLSSDRGNNNFTGDISEAFACMAMIGANGCGFEHQFESARLALQRAENPVDPENGGFLRPDAHLAVIMLTNEDDCSASADSRLFDPNQQTLADPVGGLQSYRCNEFGHLCDGQRPPHQVTTPVTLTNCTSAEDQGELVTVAGFVAFLKGLKNTPNQVFVAALAGPVIPYVVEPHSFTLGTGAMEIQPSLRHSCLPAGTYADPAVRVKTWTDAFGPNGTFESVCPDDLAPPMMRIAQSLANVVQP